MRNTRKLLLPVIFLLCLLLAGCRENKKQTEFVVGVSQCSDTPWRQRLNHELIVEQIFHPNIELRFRNAQADSKLQSLQIDSFIHEKVDLLIVAPNDEEGVSPAIGRAYDAGIPVVVTDRRALGNKWTAFVGADNRQIGELIGNWLCYQLESDQLQDIRMLEICGEKGSSSAEYRHKGMMDMIDGQSGIRLLASAEGRWLQEEAERVTDSLLRAYPEANVVFAHNDDMARGVHNVAERMGKDLIIIGVDAIPGPDQGLEALIRGDIEVSATCSGRGDLVLQTAAKILERKPYARDTLFECMLIDKTSAKGMLMHDNLLERDAAAVQLLQNKMGDLTMVQVLQRWIIVVLLLFSALTVGLLICQWRLWRHKKEALLERKAHEAVVEKQKQQLDELTAELSKAQVTEKQEPEFLRRVKEEIEAHISDSELDVEQLATMLGMSRAGLYRKTKEATGMSPVELVRHIRLHKAQSMLQNTSMSIQEIAFDVGFATPSYFTKCYKEVFGKLPGDER